jgi:hypothetical protein
LWIERACFENGHASGPGVHNASWTHELFGSKRIYRIGTNPSWRIISIHGKATLAKA